MKPQNDASLDRELRAIFRSPSRPGLLEKLKSNIPDAVILAGETAPTESGPRRWPLRLAATVALAVVGATVTWQVVKTRQAKGVRHRNRGGHDSGDRCRARSPLFRRTSRLLLPRRLRRQRWPSPPNWHPNDLDPPY